MKKENRIQSAVVFVRCALYARALSEGGAEAVPSDQVDTHSSQMHAYSFPQSALMPCHKSKNLHRRCDFILFEHVNEKSST